MISSEDYQIWEYVEINLCQGTKMNRDKGNMTMKNFSQIVNLKIHNNYRLLDHAIQMFQAIQV